MHERLYCLLFIYFILLLNACGEGRPGGSTGVELEAPNSFIATPLNESVVLRWSALNNLTYDIYWSTDENFSVKDANVFEDKSPPFKHENLQNDVTYYYIVQASLGRKKSPVSNKVSATPSSLKALKAPENFQLVHANASVTLSWDIVEGAEKYRIYWTTKGDEAPTDSVNEPIEVTTNVYNHINLENDVQYYYMITAVGFDEESSATERKWAMPQLVLPGVATNLVIKGFGGNSVSIEWSAAENAERYTVYYSIAGPDFNIGTAKFEEVSPGVTVFNLGGLKRGNIYYLKVVAVNVDGPGLPSDALEVDFTGSSGETDISIIAPKNVVPTVDGITANIQWEIVDSRYEYKVYYATEPGITKSNFSSLENGANSSLLKIPTFNLDNLSIGRMYYAIVVAIFGDAESVASKEVSFLISIPDATFLTADIENGANLYTKWWKEDFSAPTVFNPVWDDAAEDFEGNKISPLTEAESWRCAQCHGWDYRGRDGEFGVGSINYTGFPGLFEAANTKTREEIYGFIQNGKTSKNKVHSFNQLKQREVLDLTRFIMSEAIKPLDIWSGDATVGKTVYTQKNSAGNACQDSSCHADIPNSNDEKYLLLQSALEQPARFIHYTRFGVGLMPGGTSLENAIHVLAYLWDEKLVDVNDNFQIENYFKSGAALYDQWALGGLLYDRWWYAIAVEKSPQPLGNHPLWPSEETVVNGADTWRCKECHGWDYRGRNGAYARGKHFTGIPGIVGANTKVNSILEIYNFLRTGGQHAYASFLSDEEIYALTRFVQEIRREAIEASAPSDLLDAVKQQPLNFSLSLGKGMYEDVITFGGCINCHTVNDKFWFFSDNDPERGSIQTLDSIAKNNPWEFLHKVRFGHPGSIMKGIIQFESTSPVAAVDLLGYTQTELAPDIKRGGRLYDTWWLENGLIKPTESHPLWPANITGFRAEETWRCVSCHGWDYQGDHGLTGLINPQRDISVFIENGTSINSGDHAFVSQLKRQDIFDLTAFITSADNTGVRNDISLLISNADSVAGNTEYISTTPGNCINCHGEHGTSIANVDLETVANNYQARFIHKARFGSPASIMVPSLDRFLGLTAVQAANANAYALTIASSANINQAGLDRGGRLFDNWFREMRISDETVSDPAVENPLWQLRKDSIPDLTSLSDSWRCISCHSWNYKGIDLLAVDPEADNIVNRLALRKANIANEEDLANYFYDWIKNGTSGGYHNYGSPDSGLPTVLGDRELKELALFIMKGVIDTSEYIYNIDGNVINADVTNGQALYNGDLLTDVVCVDCHGVSGENIPPGGGRSVDIFAVANDNPWQFLHKVRFAASGTAMPSLVGLPGTNLQQALDVLAYAQAEFSKRP